MFYLFFGRSFTPRNFSSNLNEKNLGSIYIVYLFLINNFMFYFVGKSLKNNYLLHNFSSSVQSFVASSMSFICKTYLKFFPKLFLV